MMMNHLTIHELAARLEGRRTVLHQIGDRSPELRQAIQDTIHLMREACVRLHQQRADITALKEERAMLLKRMEDNLPPPRRKKKAPGPDVPDKKPQEA